jgi:AraC family transcriptional regulator
MHAELREFPATRVLCRRHTGAYNQIGTAFGELFPLLQGVPIQGPPIAIFHDDPGHVSEDQLRSDAAVPVPSDFDQTPDGLQLLDMPGGAYAVGLFRGPYDGLGEAWSQFESQSVPETGRRARDGYCFERYLNDCDEVAPEELLTEIWVPVA